MKRVSNCLRVLCIFVVGTTAAFAGDTAPPVTNGTAPNHQVAITAFISGRVMRLRLVRQPGNKIVGTLTEVEPDDAASHYAVSWSPDSQYAAITWTNGMRGNNGNGLILYRITPARATLVRLPNLLTTTHSVRIGFTQSTASTRYFDFEWKKANRFELTQTLTWNKVSKRRFPHGTYFVGNNPQPSGVEDVNFSATAQCHIAGTHCEVVSVAPGPDEGSN